MIYILTKHGVYNRKHHLLVLCKCKRGDDFKSRKEHECKQLSKDELTCLYNKSLERYKIKRANTQIYTDKRHMK